MCSFAHNGNSLQSKASYNLLGRPLLLPDNLFDIVSHLRVEFARIIAPFLAFRGIYLRLPKGISSARGLIPSDLSRDSTSGHSNGSCHERIGLTLLQKSINCVSLLSAQVVVFFHIQRKYKLFESNHPGASPGVVFVYLSVALTTGKYKKKQVGVEPMSGCFCP
ncbi:Uncharacterised protein [Porphyromonas endodontalis]|nr:Uncharacterised protein [Porphyromonas endodontalis]